MIYIKSIYNSYIDKISFELEKEINKVIDNEMIIRLASHEFTLHNYENQIYVEYQIFDSLKYNNLLITLQSNDSYQEFEFDTLQNNSIIHNSIDVANQVMQDRRFEQGSYIDIRIIDSLFKTKHHAMVSNKLSESFTINLNIIGIENIIRNLIENSLKYSDNEVTIIVEFKAVNDDLFISVEDNGWGIAPNHQKHLFNSYYQISHPQSKHHGFGIGLFQVKQIIEAHNGTITIESKEYKGTTFCCTLKHS